MLLNADLQSSESRYAELIDQCNSLKKGREEFDEREKVVDLKAIEQKYNELKFEHLCPMLRMQAQGTHCCLW
ncbi:hypothetical protein CASFOL_034188 [Castilleja foliolosa]|uniref:Uncharacterized protein n=1 Tax=Castilleja foliolosa TaxID=1961234 RepID=A0ABD3BZE3_9LAMI